MPVMQINTTRLSVRDSARLVPRQREIGTEDSELTDDSQGGCEQPQPPNKASIFPKRTDHLDL